MKVIEVFTGNSETRRDEFESIAEQQLITVSLVQGDPRMRASMVAAFRESEILRCVSACVNVREALKSITAARPQVVVLDLDTPGMDGSSLVAAIKETVPGVEVLAMSDSDEIDVILAALRAGANGYLVKPISAAQLVEAIEQIHTGGSPFSPAVTRELLYHWRRATPPATGIERLTDREQEILGLLAEGCLYREIATCVGISICTVRAHVHSIYGKLDARTRAEAVLHYFGRKKVER